jgi:hypothetical protein
MRNQMILHMILLILSIFVLSFFDIPSFFIRFALLTLFATITVSVTMYDMLLSLMIIPRF